MPASSTNVGDKSFGNRPAGACSGAGFAAATPVPGSCGGFAAGFAAACGTTGASCRCSVAFFLDDALSLRRFFFDGLMGKPLLHGTHLF
jgi:hypothetical protein